MAEAKKDTLIQRVESTEEFLRIYLALKPLFFFKYDFYIIIDDKEKQKRSTYKGKLPKKSQLFFLTSEETGEEIPADFFGNRHGGEVLVFLKVLPKTVQFFVKLEERWGLVEVSEWQNVSQQSLKSLKTVAVIPCYNVSKHCGDVFRGAIAFATHAIAVDDGSTDDTGQILRKEAAENPEKAHIVTLATNSGKGFALLEGFKYALEHFDFDALVTLDADGQHRPSDIPFLAASIKSGQELVIGSRLFRLMPLRSYIGNRIIAFFLRCFYPSAPLDTQSGLRAFSRDFVQEIVQKVPGGCYEMELECLLLALSEQRRVGSVAISTLYIEENTSSHFSPIRDSMKILKILFSHVVHR